MRACCCCSPRATRCVRCHAPGLVSFGLDDRGALPDEPPAALASYIGHLAFWRYADSFWHMPGMLKKRAKFVELAQDGAQLARVRKILLGMRLREDLPMATCLWFWSFVFLALQDEAAGAEVVDKILAEDVSVEDGELIRSCLLRYLAASERPGWRRVSRRVRDGRAAIRTAIYIVSAMFRSVCLRCKRPNPIACARRSRRSRRALASWCCNTRAKRAIR